MLEMGDANAYQFKITSESLYLVDSYMYMVPVVKRMRDDYSVAQERELELERERVGHAKYLRCSLANTNLESQASHHDLFIHGTCNKFNVPVHGTCSKMYL